MKRLTLEVFILIIDRQIADWESLSPLLRAENWYVEITDRLPLATQPFPHRQPDIVFLGNHPEQNFAAVGHILQSAPVIIVGQAHDPYPSLSEMVATAPGLTIKDVWQKPLNPHDVVLKLRFYLQQQQHIQQLTEHNCQLKQQLEAARLVEQSLRRSEEMFTRNDAFLRSIYEANKIRLLQLATIVEFSADAIVGMAPDCTIRSWNPGAEVLYGYQAKEVEGRRIDFLLTSSSINTSGIPLEELIRQLSEMDYQEAQHRRKNGDLVDVSIKVCLIRNTRREVIGISMICRDITSLVQQRNALWHSAERERAMVEELRQAKEAAEQASRAKSTFLANMSHELRTPLNAILGFAQLLQDSPHLDFEEKEELQIIQQSGERLLELINEILDLSKVESGQMTLHPVHFELPELLAELERLFRLRSRSKNFQLRFEVHPAVPSCLLADQQKLRQVLVNLLSNAVKFTTTGHVILRVMPHWAKHSPMCPADQPDDIQILHFEVEDTGCGIPEQDLQQIFKPFVQSSLRSPVSVSSTEQYHGTGLGLVISDRFVKLMEGQLQVSSEVGRGSTFQFSIPVRCSEVLEVDAAVAPTAKPPISKPQMLGSAEGQPQYRILVVEDEKSHQKLLMHLLRRYGFIVCVANDGEAALQLWQDWKPDLIWLDLRLPKLSGYEVAKTIRQIERANPDRYRSATPILALTAAVFTEDRQKAFAAGCDDFLSKPFQEQEVLNKMARLLCLTCII